MSIGFRCNEKIGTGPRVIFHRGVPNGFMSFFRTVFVVLTRTAEDERTEILVPVTVRRLRFRNDPGPQPLQILQSYGAFSDAF
jgi:hypothetical protein